MHSWFLAVLLAANSILVVSTQPLGAEERLCGGYDETPVTNADVSAAAQFAVTAQAAQPDQKSAIALVDILSARQQVVAGINYRLWLKVRVEGKDHDAEAIVWRHLTGELELTSWEWKAFGDRTGTFVLIDGASCNVSDSDPRASSEKLPPCSTFKIWNTLIGLETGIISSPDDPFYTWDGQVRAIPAWNRDLTLKEAFQASCVPAFQALARKIGQTRMQTWIDTLSCGDRDTSAGIDAFWLPAKGRKPLLITPMEQAQLMYRLANAKLPVAATSLRTLKSIMIVKTTAKGVLYGKTGSAMNDDGRYNLGWFVGFVESQGVVCAFACDAKGDGVMGKDARAIAEHLLEARGLL